MVGTRNHPEGDFPSTPTPSSTTPGTSRSPTTSTPTSPSSSQTLTRPKRSGGTTSSSRSNSSAWTHTPSNLTLLWLAISLPVVCWDTAYILGRPATMPGGWLHSPIFKPYALYGQVDHVYGFPEYEKGDGFGSAQGAVNALETVGYATYLYLVAAYGTQEGVKGRGAPRVGGGMGMLQDLSRARSVRGQVGAFAVVLGFATAMVTFSKTLLYWLNEYFSGAAHVGHNTLGSLIFLYIIPSAPWLLIPAYMSYVFGAEIVEGLENSAGVGESKKLS